MSTLPIIPDTAPFTAEQRSWLNGFLAGVLSRGAAPAPSSSGSAAVPLLVLFGSQSGNAEGLAKKVAKEANARGFSARAAGMDSINAAALAAESNVLIVTSTWGEGDMPDNAAGFWDQLNQNGSSPKLGSMRYSVLALGDMNYADTFCFAGRRLDERLAELGASRIHPRQDCDVDFEAPAKAWTAGALEALLAAPAAVKTQQAETAPGPTVPTPQGFSKKNPCPAPLLENRLLNARGSAKDTRHITFSLPAEGMEYEAGDALGVFASNCPGVVDQVLHAHGLSGEAAVTIEDGPTLSLREALLHHFEIRTLLGITPAAKVSPAEFIAGLRKLQPRLYSISSSPKAHPGEVHLTVSAVRYDKDGHHHKGVASTFLADRLPIGDPVRVFIQRSPHFRVPADPAVPIIMVGPGTGIAPFRAFLEEREKTGATGKNWLFFGDQRQATDFLYSEQLTAWQRQGHLRLDLAFSRDQKEKIYVQDRMREHAAELWAWLEEGAHFYVCGDASRMAKDVDAALHEIIRTAGGKTEEEAAALVAELKKSKRYVRDVY